MWLAVLVAVGALVMLAGVMVLLVSAGRARRRTDQALAEAMAAARTLRTDVAALRDQVAPSSDAVPVRTDEPEYLITRLGEDVVPAAPTVPAPVFADIVMRESVIKTASLAAGVRRALSPEVRHRIRFAMKREVKRSRKQRKVDLRQARREWEARQRSRMDSAVGEAS